MLDDHQGAAGVAGPATSASMARGRAGMIRLPAMKRLTCIALAAGLLAASAAFAGEAAGERYPSDEALRHYLAGRWLEQTGKLEEAGAELARAAALDPASPGILLHACEVASRAGEPTRALELARHVLDLSPGNGRALWLEGAALFNLSRAGEALSPLLRAVAVDSGNAECIRTLAHVAESLDRVALMDSCYERIVALDTDDAESWFQLATTRARLGRFAEADSALSIAMDASPARPGALFLRGWLRERLGHPDEAIQLYGHHLEVHPDDVATRRRLVPLLMQQGRPREALAQARKVADAQPTDASALGALADLEYLNGQPDAGAKSLQRMRALAPLDPELAARSAEVMLRNRRGPDAVRFVDAWVAAHPGAGNDLRLRGWVRAAAGSPDSAAVYARLEAAASPDSLAPARLLARYLRQARRWREAAEQYASLSRRVPSDPSLLLDLAVCREQGGDVSGAIAAGRDALALAPDAPQTLNFLGYLLADHEQDLPAAREMIRRAIELDPDNGAYLDSMGWVLFRLGDLAAARTHLERAVALTGEDPVVREHLGDVYRELKLPDLARAQYRLSLAADSANSRVRNKLEAVH
jgi:tetratricopeptide (TPR) repeat protein